MTRLIGFSLLFMSFLLSGKVAAENFTADHLVRLDRVGAPVLSPDGSMIVYSLRKTDMEANKGRYDLWLTALTKARDQWPEWYISPLLELYSPIGSPERLRRFRSDPRTKAYLEELKLPEYWRQVGWPEICQPSGVDDFFCS